jgi:hypothetical protein
MHRSWVTSSLAVGLVSTSVLLTGCAVAQGSTQAEQVAMGHELTVFRSPTYG